MLPAMNQCSIAIIGAGRLGSALAVALTRAGVRVSEIISRQTRSSARSRQVAREVKARLLMLNQGAPQAEIAWLCVPDAAISRVCESVAQSDWSGKIAFHSSGVLTSAALQPLRRRGRSVASVHPLMTFVRGSRPELRNVPFAVEGDAEAVSVATEIVEMLGGDVLRLRKNAKVPYHAFATMVCPLLVALLASAEKIAALAGMSDLDARRSMIPILRQTLRNYEKLGARKSFSGPLVRGDVDTVGLHLRSLKKAPAAKAAYVALALAALKDLPVRNEREIRALLSGPQGGRRKMQTAAVSSRSRKAQRSGRRTRRASRPSTHRG
jgi:predicted short-subunit dehydrogenase-like oxidoreductase (DUF2520 family)